MISPATKLVEDSLRVNEIAVVSPAIRAVLFALKAMEGTTVSTARVILLFASEPSALVFPAASVKTPLATLTKALFVLLGVGVNKAV